MKKEAKEVIDNRVKKEKQDYGENSPEFAETMMIMGHHLKACEILFKIEPLDEEKIMKCLDKLSYSNTGKACIKVFKKWLHHLESHYAKNNRRIGIVLLQLAVKHHHLEHIPIAQEYLKRSHLVFSHHNDRLHLRTIEDVRRHWNEKSKVPFHIANIVCHDMDDDGTLFRRKYNTETFSRKPFSG